MAFMGRIPFCNAVEHRRAAAVPLRLNWNQTERADGAQAGSIKYGERAGL